MNAEEQTQAVLLEILDELKKLNYRPEEPEADGEGFCPFIKDCCRHDCVMYSGRYSCQLADAQFDIEQFLNVSDENADPVESSIMGGYFFDAMKRIATD